jgi:non-specific serine/threonine protein kinase
MHRDKNMRYATWKAFCDDLATALPGIESLEDIHFNSARYDELRNLAFFTHFTDNEVWETVGLSHWQEVKLGENIITEGEKSSSLYLIITGEASVTKSEVELTRMQIGSCFGEIAYLDDTRHTRQATVTALTEMRLIEIQGESLKLASDGLQASFAKALLNVMIARIKDTDRRLLSILLAQQSGEKMNSLNSGE